MQFLKKTLIFCFVLFPGLALAAWEVNLPEGVTPISRDIYDLHMIVLYICCVIGVLVYGLIFYSVFAHRKSRGQQPAKFSHSTAAEVTWTIIPFLILVAMAIPATNTLIEMENFSQSDMTIKAAGLQWRWHYEYEGEDVSFYSALDANSNAAAMLDSGIEPTSVDNYLLEVDNPMVIPVGKYVQLLLTSYDVIHAWWVPELGMKRDAIPGYVTRIWIRVDEPGIYRGQCAELCGRGHGYMPIVVHAVSEEQYQTWLDSQRPNQDPSIKAEATRSEPASSAKNLSSSEVVPNALSSDTIAPEITAGQPALDADTTLATLPPETL